MCFFPLNEMDMPLGLDFLFLRTLLTGSPGVFEVAGGMMMPSMLCLRLMCMCSRQDFWPS